MQKTILFLSKGENASSTRYRALQYFSLYQEAGFQPEHLTISGGLSAFLKALQLARQADIVVLIRKTFPYPIFWLLRKCSKRLIFDFDDAIFCNTNGTDSNTRLTRFNQTVSHCDFVFAGNQYLANQAKNSQDMVAVIPTSVETAKYDKDQSIENSTSQPFTLVWIGSKSTKKYIAGILPSIEAAARVIPNLRLKIIADFSLHSDFVNIENVAWSEETEAKEVYTSDIGLAPLPPDNWTKGKCALKVLQYMAASLPVITSPTSVNGEVIEPLVSGYFAEDDSTWTSTIIQAYEDRSLLPKMGENAHVSVTNAFDIKVVFSKKIQIIKQLLLN